MPTSAASSSFVKRHGPALAALVLMALAGLGFLLAPGLAPYSPFSDFLPLGLASKTVLRESVLSGRLPFWRSDMFSGMAALSDPQNAYLSPLNVLFWLAPPLQALGPSIWLCFLAAGLSGYGAAALLGLGPWGCLAAATAWMFDFKLACYLELFPGSHWIAAAILPLILSSAWRLCENPDPRGAAVLAASAGVCALSGQLQLAYDAALFCLPLFLARGRKSFRWLAAGGALAAGLAAPLLLPLAAQAPLLSRGGGTREFFLSGHALGPSAWLGFLMPTMPGAAGSVEPWEDACFFGLAALALAGAGAWLGRKRVEVRWLAGGFAGACLLALDTPLHRALAFAPGWSWFRIPGRFFFLSGWFGAALAGFGLEQVLSRVKRGKSARSAAAAALVAVMFVEGAWRAGALVTMEPPGTLSPPSALSAIVSAERRVLPVGRSAFNYGWAAGAGLRLAAGFGSYNYARYQEYCDLLRWNRLRPEGARVWTDFPSISRPDLLDALGAGYIASRAALALPRERFAPAGILRGQAAFDLYKGLSRSDLFVYENKRARPRAFFAVRVLAATGHGEALRLARAESLSGAAIVEGAPPASGPPNEADRVDASSSGPGICDARLRSSGARFLVITEVWDPGWRASLDGAPVPIYPADLALMGVWVPAGEHRLALRYRLVGWDAGIALGILSAAAWLALVLLGRRRVGSPRAR